MDGVGDDGATAGNSPGPAKAERRLLAVRSRIDAVTETVVLNASRVPSAIAEVKGLKAHVDALFPLVTSDPGALTSALDELDQRLAGLRTKLTQAGLKLPGEESPAPAATPAAPPTVDAPSPKPEQEGAEQGSDVPPVAEPPPREPLRRRTPRLVAPPAEPPQTARPADPPRESKSPAPASPTRPPARKERRRRPRRPAFDRAQRREAVEALTTHYREFLDTERAAAQEAENERATRQAREPQTVEPLPVLEAREQIVGLLRDRRVGMLCGETGSGKTLLAPFLAMEAGLADDRMIVQTEPRRVAARQIAHRLSQMGGRKLGDAFGLHTRTERVVGRRSLVKVATDGILLNELRDDPMLSRYNLVILDEAHERSVNIDLLLGMIMQLMEQRDDLKLLVVSATIDEEQFARFLKLEDDQIVRVPGRMFPVDMRYEPFEPERQGEYLTDVPVQAALAVKAIQDEGPGDVLIFMPRAREIMATIKALRDVGVRMSEIEPIPMHGGLRPEDNDRAFATSHKRKVIIATNIAETSITVPGIRYVIDGGFVNLKRFNPRTGIESLRPERISQASAKQRAGRAGRVEHGVCIRLYDEEQFAQLKPHTDPEIVRSDLAHLVLYMRSIGIRHLKKFPFVDPPDQHQLKNAQEKLHELGALTAKKQRDSEVTDIGQKMAALPLEPGLARMLLQAESEQCVEEMLSIAACLSVGRDLFTLPKPGEDGAGGIDRARQQINRARRDFADKNSDFVALLNIYREWARARRREKDRFCKQNHLSYRVLEEASTIRSDLVDAVKNHNIHFTSTSDYDAVNRCVLAGHVQNVCVAAGKYDYSAIGKQVAYLHPASVYFDAGKRPQVMVARTLERGENKIFARDVAEVQPGWIEKLAGHLCSFVYEDRRFDPQQKRVLAKESIFYQDLTLIEGREVDLLKRNPEEGLRVLVTDALLKDRLGVDTSFVRHNAAILEEARTAAVRIGDRDLIPDEETLVDHYVERLSGCASFNAVRNKLRNERRLLELRIDDFIPRERIIEANRLYPEEIKLAGGPVEVSYIDDPFNERTQVVIAVPVRNVPLLTPGDLERSIPGLVRRRIDLIAELIDAARTPTDAVGVLATDTRGSAMQAVAGELPADAPATPIDCESLTASFLARSEPDATTWNHVAGSVAASHSITLTDAIRNEYERVASAEQLRPFVDVVRADSSSLRITADFTEIQRSVVSEKVKAAWEAARAEHSTAPTDRYQDVPPLLDGLLQRVPVLTAKPGDPTPAIDGFTALECDPARGRIRRTLAESRDHAVGMTSRALAEFARWQLMLNPALHFTLEQLSLPESTEQRFYEVTGDATSLVGKVRRLLMRTGARAELTAADIEAGRTRILALQEAAREGLKPALGNVVERVDELLETYDLAHRTAWSSGKAQPEIAAALDTALSEIRHLDELTWTDLPPLIGRLEVLAQAAARRAPMEADELKRALRAGAEAAREAVEPVAIRPTPAKQPAGAAATPPRPTGKKKKKKKGKDAPPTWKPPAAPDRDATEPKPAPARPAHAPTAPPKTAPVAPALRPPSRAATPSSPDPQARKRRRKNRSKYVALLHRKADGDELRDVLDRLFDELVDAGDVDVDAEIEWDDDAASDAQLGALIEIDERTDAWVTAARIAQDEVWAEHDGSEPPHQRVLEIAARARKILHDA
jgi:RNA helicase HrpA